MLKFPVVGPTTWSKARDGLTRGPWTARPGAAHHRGTPMTLMTIVILVWAVTALFVAGLCAASRIGDAL